MASTFSIFAASGMPAAPSKITPPPLPNLADEPATEFFDFIGLAGVEQGRRHVAAQANNAAESLLGLEEVLRSKQ